MTDNEGKSINGSLHKVKTLNKSSFLIENTLNFTPYERNGTAKLIKQPITLNFQPLHEILTKPPIDLAQSDFMKLDNPLLTHIGYETLSGFLP